MLTGSTISEKAFSAIYSGAIKQDKPAIDKALEVVSLNVQIGEHCSPAYELARQCTPQTEKGLEFLITTYPLERLSLIRESVPGYISAGHLDRANHMVKFPQNASEYRFFLTIIISSLAWHGQKDEARKRWNQATPKERQAILEPMVNGYAYAGDANEVKRLLEENPLERMNLYPGIAGGYAAAGNIQGINQCLSAVHSVEKDTILYHAGYFLSLFGHESATCELRADHPRNRLGLLNAMIAGYATAGQVDKALAILDQARSPDEKKALYESMMVGYACGGHTHEAENLIAHCDPPDNLEANEIEQFSAHYQKKHLLTQDLVSHLAQCGHISQAQKKRTECKREGFKYLSLIMNGLVVYGDLHQARAAFDEAMTLGDDFRAIDPTHHFRLLSEFVRTHAFFRKMDETNGLLNEYENETDLPSEVIKAYARNGNQVEANKLLTRIEDPKIKKETIIKMACCYASQGHFFQVNALLSEHPGHRSDLLAEIAKGYVSADYLTEAVELVEENEENEENNEQSSHLLKNIADTFAESTLPESDSTLFMLARFKPDHQATLISETKTNVKTILPKTTQLHLLLTTPAPLTQPVNYRILLQRDWLLAQDFLLKIAQHFQHKLNEDMVILLLPFLLPLNRNESCDFYNRFCETYPRARKMNQYPHLFHESKQEEKHSSTIPPVSFHLSAQKNQPKKTAR